MSWVIAIAGFCVLIMAHEAGHFLAAKAVGMRVERFSLFFPPKLLSFRRGETEYQIGAVPLGGYVKITGMSPDEVEGLEPELVERAYYNKAPWRRIVVILAGPGVNLLLALVLFTVVLWSGSLDGATAIGNLSSQQTLRLGTGAVVQSVDAGSGASGVLRAKDRIVAIDGRKVNINDVSAALDSSRCAGAAVNGCAASAPIAVTVERGGHPVTVYVTPHYDAKLKRMIMGVELSAPVMAKHFGVLSGIGTSGAALWDVATSTVTNYVRAFTSSKVRHQLSSVVGITQDTQQAVTRGPGFALVVLGLVSLVLAVVNLFPFLPLDGGHVLWSVVEKVRGKRVSLSAMWRFSSVGIVLLAFLVLNGISNDISRLGG
jgi:regulator of sigma E protease